MAKKRKKKKRSVPYRPLAFGALILATLGILAFALHKKEAPPLICDATETYPLTNEEPEPCCEGLMLIPPMIKPPLVYRERTRAPVVFQPSCTNTLLEAKVGYFFPQTPVLRIAITVGSAMALRPQSASAAVSLAF